MPITQCQARQDISGLIEKYQAMPKPNRQSITDALVAHLYNLTRDDFEHILGTFPLVLPDDAEEEARKEALLVVYDRFSDQVRDWSRQ